MVLYFFSLGYAIVTPAMAKFAEAFPDREYALINSLPTLFIGVAGLLVGPLAGRRMKCRTLAVLGSLISLVAGMGPAFTDSFELVLLCRAALGFGLGLLIPLANTLVNGNYAGDRRAMLLSAGSLALNAGGVILQYLGGILAESGWQNTFYAYALFAAALVASFFIPEIESAATHGVGRPGKGIIAISLLFALYGMLQFSVMQNIAELFEMRDAGGASSAGLALSIFTIAGCIGGLMYMPVKRKAPRAAFPVVWGCTAAGAAVIASTATQLSMTAGLVIFGIGFGMVIPAFIDWTGRVCSAATLAAGTAIVTASMYFGDFASVAWKFVADALFGEHIVSNLWVLSAVGTVLFAVFAFMDPFGDEDEQDMI